MSGAIKPPGGGPGPLDPVVGGQAPEQADAAEQALGSQHAEAAAPSSTTGTEAWLQRVDAGEITPEEAVDGIVAEALEAHGGARLPQAQRAELEQVLKTALLEDPTLSALLAGTRA